MRNNLTLSLDQNIALTGGKVSVFTQLNRLDQYAPERNITYNSQPINITYIQPLRAFNSLKWQKKTQPKEYEKAKRSYLETMEILPLRLLRCFSMRCCRSGTSKGPRENYQNTETLYRIAKERFELGKVTKSELLQARTTAAERRPVDQSESVESGYEPVETEIVPRIQRKRATGAGAARFDSRTRAECKRGGRSPMPILLSDSVRNFPCCTPNSPSPKPRRTGDFRPRSAPSSTDSAE